MGQRHYWKYLEILEKYSIPPNFWTSREYFEKSNFIEKEQDLFVWIEDNEYTQIFPTLRDPGGLTSKLNRSMVWSDFPGFEIVGKKTFLDFEYIFNPEHFLTMEGGKWAVFRKNCRKFPRDYPNLIYDRNGNSNEAIDLFVEWMEGKDSDQEIYDDQIIEGYLYNAENIKFLRDKYQVYGINIWDENYMYINFRFCFCKNIPFLSEYMRYIFYTDHDILFRNKLVNDGGSLDNEALRRFKLKMNPIRVREVYSWTI